MTGPESPAATPSRPGPLLAAISLVVAVAGLGCQRPTPPALTAYAGADLLVADSLLRPAPILEIDAFGNPVDHLDRRTLLEWLASRRYDLLDSLLDARWKQTQHDIRNESLLSGAFWAFHRGLADLGPRLNDWVQQRPGSGHARLARAYYYLARAYESRGPASTFETSRSQFDNMDRYAKLAATEAAAGMALLPNHLLGYETLLGVAQLTGGLEAEAKVRLINTALTAHPGSFVLAESALNMLEPRWGGSYQAMETVARYGSQHILANPHLAALPALVEVERARVSRRGEDYGAALEHLTRALELAAPDYAVALELAELNLAQRDYLEAMRYVRIAESQRPQGWSMLELKGSALLSIAHLAPAPIRDSAFAQSIAAYRLLQDLRPPQVYPEPSLAYALAEQKRCSAAPPPCSFE